MRNLLLLVAIAALPGFARAQLLIAPQSTFLTQPGTTVLTWRHASFRSQAVYDSSHFTSQGVVGQISINRLRFRAANGVTNAGGQYTGVNLAIGTSANDHLAVSTAFAQNLGAMQQVMTNGTVNVAPATGTTPNDYVIDISIPGGFLYNPTLGQDLLLDISAAAVTGAVPALASAGSTATDLCRSVYNSPASATSGVFSGTPAIVLFDISGGPGGIPGIVQAAVAQYGVGCYDRARSFAEVFPGSGGTHDLQSGLTVLPNITGAPTGYVLLPGFNPTFFPHAGPKLLNNAATPAALSDDSMSQACLLPFTFPFVGGSTTVIHADTNGYIVLGPTTTLGGDTTSSITDLVGTTTGTHSGLPRFCPYWYDLHPTRNTGNPAAGLYFDVDTVNQKAYLTYDDFGEFATSTAGTKTFTFQVEFSADGTIEVRYGVMSPMGSTTGALVGFSPGTGSRVPTPIDISASIPFLTSTADRTPLALTMTAPVIGTSSTVTTTNIPTSPGAFLHMVSATQLDPGVDLGIAGAPGCNAYLDPGAELQSSIHVGAPTAVFALPIPFAVNLIGLQAYCQSFALDPGANAFGIVGSNGTALLIGSL